MRTDTKKIANNLSSIIAKAITYIPDSKKLNTTIHKSAKKLAKKLVRLQGNMVQSTPIIIEKIIANTTHKATKHRVVATGK